MRIISFSLLVALYTMAVANISITEAQVMPSANPPGAASPVPTADALQDEPHGSQPVSTKASNTGADQPASTVAPSLPSPNVGSNASARDYLHAARIALATGSTGEAQQALEMAQTRLLDRSTPLFQTNTPSGNPAVEKISSAIKALGAGDRMQAMQLIDEAMPLAAEPPPQ
jgi:hypothetical protein